MRRLANVSIDLDGLACYHQIHGLVGSPDPTAIYTVALPRFRELFAQFNIRATLFVIASDLERPAVVEALREAIDEGHEVASHSYRHPYNLREWTERGITAEIAEAEAAFENYLGVRPRGFRAPGYNIDTRIVRILAERGYRYDSSVFPCPPYYFAKAAVMGWMSLTGNQSGSAMTDPAALRAPLQPYRPSRWNFARPGDRKHSLPLWEIPIGVTPLTRVPVIGTTMGAMSPSKARLLYKLFKRGQNTLQYEFHGIDLMDSTDEAVTDELSAKQPDVRRSWHMKRDAFEAIFDATLNDYALVPLIDIADELDREAGPTVIAG